MLKVEDLKFYYGPSRGKQEDSFSLEVESFHLAPGETLFLQGPSGCGKSTFLELLCGVLLPKSGKIFFRGVDLTELSEKARDQLRGFEMGYVFQSFNLMPYLTVLENLVLPMQLHGKHTDFVRAKASLQSLGLLDKQNHFACELSVGQQQRVAIARSLLHEPKLILADEPTSALDQINSDQALDFLFSEVKRLGASLILVSHDSQIAYRFDRTLQAAELFKKPRKELIKGELTKNQAREKKSHEGPQAKRGPNE
jgi:putative ABC transport system ATP-binding protein